MTFDIPSTSASKDANALSTTSSGAASPAGTPPSAGHKAFGEVMAQAFGEKNGQAAATDKTAQAPGTEEESGQALADGGTSTIDKVDVALLPPWMQALPQNLAVQPVQPGSGLQVITTSAPAPNDASLIAFAQAQGLDANAIAMLLQKQAPQGQSAPTGTPAGTPGWAQIGTLTHTPGLGAPGALSMATGLPGSPAATASAADSSTLTTGLPGLPSTADGDAATAIQNMVTQAQAQSSSGAAPVPSASIGLTAAALGLTAAQLTGKALSQAPSDASALSQSAQAAEQSLDLPPGIGQSLAMLSLRKIQAEGKTAGSDTRTSGDLPFAAQAGLNWKESELDLSAALASDSAPDLPDGTPSSSALLASDSQPSKDMVAPATPQTGPSAAAKTDATSAQAMPGKLASDQMQQLSEQMADAIGERMMREIERGHWNLRLMLKPAHLGHIEVEMRLHAGGLEASFATPQASTRELLQDGLDQLRSKLSEMGMDIANLDVKTGQNRQNGGDPTPGQQASAGNSSSKNTDQQPVQTTGLSSRPRRADGWDVMV